MFLVHTQNWGLHDPNLTHIISSRVAQPPTRPRLLAMFDEFSVQDLIQNLATLPSLPMGKALGILAGKFFGWMGKKSNEGRVCFLLFLRGLMDVVRWVHIPNSKGTRRKS